MVNFRFQKILNVYKSKLILLTLTNKDNMILGLLINKQNISLTKVWDFLEWFNQFVQPY